MKRIRVKLKEIKHLLNLNVDAVKHGLSEGYFQQSRPETIIDWHINKTRKIMHEQLRDVHNV
jgi:uncharacterized protein YcgL (UPF0745 family)|tara:strand:+ start:275 stop:460 length:186 start_codon:yes stop_codon:yes gene_type:complete